MAWWVEVTEKNDVRRSTDRFNISLPLNSPVSLSVLSLSLSHTQTKTPVKMALTLTADHLFYYAGCGSLGPLYLFFLFLFVKL